MANQIKLDIHVHLIPVKPDILHDIKGVNWEDSTLSIDGKPIGIKSLHKPEELLKWMDTQFIEQAWVSIPPPAYRQHLSDTDANQWHDYLDSAMADSLKINSRLSALHFLPLEHPELAIKRAKKFIDQGYNRFAIAAGGHESINYSNSALLPLWKILNQAKAFVFIHPGHCCDPRLKQNYLHNLLGNPYETAVAIGDWVFNGYGAKFAQIKLCLAHSGGAVPMTAGRWQHGFDQSRPGINKNIEPPQKALTRIMCDCIAHDKHALGLASQVFGEKNILFGSDWPFPMGLMQPHQQLSDVDQNMQTQIFGNVVE